MRSRECTGRVVTITNAKIFDEPVFNYTREFPYLWEELVLPIGYESDRDRAEQILLEFSERHTVAIRDLGEQEVRELGRRYAVDPGQMSPRVYYRLTDNWLELTVRFLTREHGVRAVKDAMTRDILRALDEAEIPVASATFATFAIVGVPPLRIRGPASPPRS